MHDPQIFDPRSISCKTPYGAVPSGTAVTFTLRPARAWGFSHLTMMARFESNENHTVEIPLDWSGLDGDRDRYVCTLEVGDYVGLVWYSFCMTTLDGRRADLGEYQLTVYDDSEQVPT